MVEASAARALMDQPMRRVRRVHFVGIGGIGMSALAQYLKDQGVEVDGSDREAAVVRYHCRLFF